ncbi:ABC transporter ATP-binding protein [Salinibacterium sp. NSLL150]|uniref:ABC transporter ATP-binding protein n=1 Tax=unclassified Salinibacterium TaxID=2632331 RepID=UPI0018CEBDD2|nr:MULTISPECIES: ABC transporter ATP-binding protein [unclassified Salinibacterium]MBH0098156.1 ABC transporter ATP-binding protein [Salinibacterium sp. NSLL35]MBH0100911.1 ABC transporter ATP-binding protein [Salinibacterium sp. NSLL150]MBH0103670.1 ABC transporter ATP-binding protein [Salinibacterium sp. NSLL16]MBH0106431.1 ABC transporter ATP-binding protein [Salinibacterium sp. NSLL17]
MTLDATIQVSRGSFSLDASVTVAPGETLALLGPNGSGKSTLLAVIAGLLAPDQGSVSVDGRVLTEVPQSGGGRMTVVPAHRRRIGLLGQDPLLFPHLNALENVAFGLRSRGLLRSNGMNATDARERASEWLAAVGMSEFAARKPAELSGGQQQRVAIARVLATEPDVLLFDEPMAALDVQNASLVRTLLRECLASRISATHTGIDGRPPTAPATIVVTHDVVDAMVLADRVAIMDAGRIIDSGDVARVLGEPVNQFAATLVGLNVLHGIVETRELVRLADGRGFAVDDVVPEVGAEVSVAFPPSAVTLRREVSAPSHPNEWHATVDLLEPGLRGIRVTLLGDTVVAETAAADLLAHDITPGDRIVASVAASQITVYPRR